MFVIRLGNSMARDHNVHLLELNKFKSKDKKMMKLLDPSIKICQPDSLLPVTLVRFVQNQIPFFPMKQFFSKSITFLKYIYVWLYVLKNRINVIHSNSWVSDYFMSRIARFCNARFIITLHGHYELLKDSMEDFTYKTSKIISAVDHIAYLTEKNLLSLKNIELNIDKCHLIFNGIPRDNSNHETWGKKGQIHFAIASRAIREKGWEETIKSAIELGNEKDYDIYLHLIGDGEIVDELRKKYSASRNIVFHGFVLNVIEYLKKIDVCILPSYYEAESMPFSVIEYLSVGKPVIASRVGYIEEMIRVENRLAGFLIELNNGRIDVGQLKKCMSLYIENPQLIREHSKDAEKAFEKFDISYCKNKYLNLYSQ